MHGVWKSQKKSHSTLQAKRPTFTFWVDKSSLKMPEMVHFGELLKTWSLRSNSVTRQNSFSRTKIGGKWQNSKFKCDILSNFQTMCECVKISLFHWFPRLNYFYLLHKKAAKPDIRDIMTCPISQIRDNVLGLWMPSSFQSLTSGSSDPVQMKWRLNFLDLVLYVRLIVITLWKKKSYLKPFGVCHSVWK